MASRLNLQLSKVTADLCMIVKEVKINKLFYVVRCTCCNINTMSPFVF